MVDLDECKEKAKWILQEEHNWEEYGYSERGNYRQKLLHDLPKPMIMFVRQYIANMTKPYRGKQSRFFNPYPEEFRK